MTDKTNDHGRPESKTNDAGCPDGVHRRQGLNNGPRPTRPAQTGRHAGIIAAFAAGGMQTHGFTAAVREATGCDGPALQPDAYSINPITQDIVMLEVEITHPIDDAKWMRVREWQDTLTPTGWTMRMFVCASDGQAVELDIYTQTITDAEFDKVRLGMETMLGFAHP